MSSEKSNAADAVEQNELVQAITMRSATYGLLSQLYRTEVDKANLNELIKMRFPARTGNEAVDKGYRLLAQYLSSTWDNTLEELAVDYSRVFIGHGLDAYSAAYPYESVYTSPKRLLMQAARDEVLALYRSAGLDKVNSWKESEDHLALELEFMQVLCQRTITALEAHKEADAVSLLELQESFLTDHLLNWVPMMTADMKRFAKTDFYEGLAYLTEGFLAEDKSFLESLTVEESE